MPTSAKATRGQQLREAFAGSSVAERGYATRSTGTGASALLVQLRGFLLEALEHVERLPALVRQAETTEHAGEDVVVGGRAWIEDDRLIQGACRGLEAAAALLGPALLKPRAIGLRIELDGLARVFERLLGVPVRL